MSVFITNSKAQILKKRLNELIKNSNELKFLVGFFYFSGIKELYESLKEKNDILIKVLVGLNVDNLIYGLVEYGENQKELSNNEKLESFFSSVTKSINSDGFDSEEFYTQAIFFIELIKKNKLLIRKTSDPNHSKLYLFKIDKPEIKDKIFITGSSNLTRSGLSGQKEFNVEISDYGTDEAEKYFDELWDEALKITENDILKQRLIDLVENKTLIADITPFEAFVLVLKTYIDAQVHKTVKEQILSLLEKKGYKRYQYQIDAVEQALSIIETYKGVIISDVVGLGKSVIAGIVAKCLKKRGVIICRPGLIGDPNSKDSGWQKYKEDFELYNWEIRSSGKLEDVLTLVRENDDFEVVIIDEAHNFRNQDTNDYDLLSHICRDKITILLSATPFNNAPNDIFSLLKLFIIPNKSAITLDDNLESRFRHYQNVFHKLSYITKNYNSKDKEKQIRAADYFIALFGSNHVEIKKVKERARYLSNKIRTIIEPVLIRRNRIDLRKDPVYSKEVTDLPEVKDPKELFYSLTPEQSEFYDKVINQYFGENGQFKGAIYRPFIYECKELLSDDELKKEENRERLSQKNLYDFMRRMLVKRFESSFGAFKQSLKNFINIIETVQKFIKKTNKYILDRALIEKIYQEDEDYIESILKDFAERLESEIQPRSNKIYEINKFEKKDKFITDIEDDKNLFNSILKELDDLRLVADDPKAKALISQIKEITNTKDNQNEPERKIVIFTEYTDTALHISEKIEPYYKDKYILVAGDLSSAKIKEINENFDASFKKQKNNFDIIVATDKISEGFNLNRAGAIINYDIPWNPTRVIQRVGRINRIGRRVFENLYIFNSFPSEQGADIVKSRQIACDKMFMIHNTLGEDAKIFDPDEEPTASALYKKVLQNPEEGEQESFQTKIRRIYFDIKANHPELIAKILSFPPRVKTAKKFQQNDLIVFIKKGLGFFVRGILEQESCLQELSKDIVKELSLEEVFQQIECDKDEPRLKLSNIFWERYEKIRTHKEEQKEATSEISVEVRARNNLKHLNKTEIAKLAEYKPFIKMLLEDILEYKILSKWTLRSIADLNIENENQIKKTIKELERLKNELGDDYLEKIKERIKNQITEIVIAIENIK